MQSLNVVLSLLIALGLDFVKDNHPEWEMQSYGMMFVLAGTSGLIGSSILASTPEPKKILPRENLFVMLRRPLKDPNFRRLLVFNSAWCLR